MYEAKVLILLSEHSIASNWVAYEVERTLNKEPQGIPNVLFPIRVDDAVLKSKAGWADDIKTHGISGISPDGKTTMSIKSFR
jgi:hypothetical protein